MVSFKCVGQIAVVMTVIGTLAAGQSLALAQEPNPAEATASPREQELRGQLKGILQELEELQKGRESAVAAGRTAEDRDRKGEAGTDRGGRGSRSDAGI